jgi:hypothetical protein
VCLSLRNAQRKSGSVKLSEIEAAIACASRSRVGAGGLFKHAKQSPFRFEEESCAKIARSIRIQIDDH